MRRKKRNGLIDLIRFLASICIMSGHYTYLFGQEYKGMKITLPFPRECGLRLSACVALFFVISGYFTAGSFGQLCARKKDPVDLFRKRFLKIMPAMWISVILFCAAATAYFVRFGHWWGKRELTLSGVFLTMAGVHTWAGTGNKINGPVWYISVLLLNLIFYLLISTAQIRKRTKLTLFFLLFLLGLSTYTMDLPFPLLEEKAARSYVSFYAGVFLCLFSKGMEEWKKVAVGAAGILVPAAVLALERAAGLDLIGDRIILYSLMIGPAVILLGETGVFQSGLFVNRVTKFLDGISFPVFLIHIPCLILLCTVRGETDYNSSSLYLQFLGLTLAAALLLYLADRGIQKMLRRALPDREGMGRLGRRGSVIRSGK